MESFYIITMISIFCMILGAALAIASIILNIYYRKKKENCTEETVAIIKEIVLEEKYDIDMSSRLVSEYPVLEYDINGKHIEKKSAVGYMPKKYSVGQKVEICYNPNKYEDFYIKNDNTINKIKKIFLTIGISILVLGIILIIVASFII